MLQLRLTPKAIEDIVAIKEYISQDSPQAATEFALQIQAALVKLARFPDMGRPLNAKLPIKTDYRCYIWQKHIVFYKLDKKYISIYRVLHGKRDYIKLLDLKE